MGKKHKRYWNDDDWWWITIENISINDIKGEITKEEILNLMMFDKKRVNQKNTLILLNRIGEAFINNDISDKEIIDFFNMENTQ